MEKISRDFLKGVYDLHFHTSPDVSERKCSDLELAGRWKAAGMKGGVIKGHYADMTGRAALLGELFPELSVAGGLALNRQAGGLNPEAVTRMAQAGGRFLWFPTLDSLEYQKYHHKNAKAGELSCFIDVCGEDGKLLPAALEVLEVVKEYGLVLCTGHIGAREGMELIRQASAMGIGKMVVTHADNPATCFSLEQQMECVRQGALIEHSYFTAYYGRTSWEQLVKEITGVGSSHIFLTTDFGQTASPHSDEGMLEYAKNLHARGIPLEDLDRMMKRNPESLLTL